MKITLATSNELTERLTGEATRHPGILEDAEQTVLLIKGATIGYACGCEENLVLCDMRANGTLKGQAQFSVRGGKELGKMLGKGEVLDNPDGSDSLKQYAYEC